MIDAQTHGQYGQDVEYDNPEEGRLDGTRHGLVGFGRLPGSHGNQLHSPVGEERKDKGLRKCREPSDEGLRVLEVGEALFATMSGSIPKAMGGQNVQGRDVPSRRPSRRRVRHK